MTTADSSASAAPTHDGALNIFVTVGTTRFDSLIRAVISDRFLRYLSHTCSTGPRERPGQGIQVVVQYGNSPIADVLTTMGAASVDEGSEIVPEPGLRIVDGRRVYQSSAKIPGLDPGQTGTIPGLRIRTTQTSSQDGSVDADPRRAGQSLFDRSLQEAQAMLGTGAPRGDWQLQGATLDATFDYGLELRVFQFAPDLKRYIESADVVISHAGSGTILDTLRTRPRAPALVVVPNTSLMDNHQVELAEALAHDGYLTVGSEGSLVNDVARARLKEHTPFPDFDPTRFANIVDEAMLD